MAMAIQQQLAKNQGDLAMMAAAMTPAQGGQARGIGDVKMSGHTPCAKRPITQATIAVAGGGNRPM